MMIKKMKANFGCLENAEMELHEGLNIITAPNESGKSTWCAFIRCMLYGIDSAQREKGGIKPDKTKYARWSGAAMAGEMEIEHEGKSITLSRGSKSAAAPFREFSALYSGTGQKVPGLSGKDAGEALTGLPKAVFESSVFVRQSGMAVQNGPELERRINAIISSGEDDAASYTDADAQLRAWLRKRRHNTSGAIPAAEAELSSLRRSLEAVGEDARLAEELEARISRASQQLQSMEQQSILRTQQQGESDLKALALAREKLEKARSACAEAEKTEAALRSEIEGSVFQGKSVEEVEKTIAGELEEYSRRDKIRVSRWIVFALLFAGLVLCLISGNPGPKLLLIPGVVLLGAAMFCAFLWRYRDNHYVGWGKMLQGKYGFSAPAQLASLPSLYRQKWEALDSARQAVLAAERDRQAAEAALAQAERSLISPQRSDFGLDSARAELEALRRRRAQLQGRLEATGDPMVIKSEAYDLQQRLGELQAQYDALALAIETLRDANDEMQQRFSPRLGQRAGEIMHALTGGEYERLAFDRSLAAEAKRSGDTLAHPTVFLSQGTADQLYLALRLAICELALPEDCSCPLILDDALVNFDNVRMGYALELLRQIARTRQVILFSCHDREEKWLTENN